MATDVPDNLRYTASDEWVRREGDELVCGITAFASDQLGDVVYVQLPSVGKRFAEGDTFGEIESVKAVSDLFCPVSGEITGVNEELDQNPGLINEDPYGRGWMLRLRPDNPADYDSLLEPSGYQQSTAERA
jgi:glycine cleavage system H protein